MWLTRYPLCVSALRCSSVVRFQSQLVLCLRTPLEQPLDRHAKTGLQLKHFSTASAESMKTATDLTGLAVAKHPHQTLKALYGRCLRSLQKMPETAAYRRYTEQIVRERLEKVEKVKSVEELEKSINCGQIEEVILQAERECDLADKFLHYRPWEPLVEQPPANQWKWPL